jgi:hypothetical protein
MADGNTLAYRDVRAMLHITDADAAHGCIAVGAARGVGAKWIRKAEPANSVHFSRLRDATALMKSVDIFLAGLQAA